MTNEMTNEHPLVGRRIEAVTKGDKQVRVWVTAVEEDTQTDRGVYVWGYRVNTRQRQIASTAFPRRYYAPKVGA